mgnify:CR=1 FL=1
MPSHELHRKWAERIGINGEISTEVDRIIDAPRHHDVVNTALNYGIDYSAVLMLFEGKTLHEIKESLTWLTRNYYGRRTQERVGQIFSEDETGVRIAAGIRDKYGIEGLRAMVCHIALDYIEQLYLRGYSREKIIEKIGEGKKGERLWSLLTKADLDGLYRHVEEIIEDISRRKPPSQILISQREEDERLWRMAGGIEGYIFVYDKKYPQPFFALKEIKAETKKGKRVHVDIALREWKIIKKHGYGIPKSSDGKYIDEREINEEIQPIVMRIIERCPIERLKLHPQIGFRSESRSNGSIVEYHTIEVTISSFEDFEYVLDELRAR